MSRALVAALLLAAALPAHAWRRSEAQEKNGDNVPGRCLYWPSSRLTYVLNPVLANRAGCGTAAAAAALARASVATWTKAAFSAAPAQVCTGWGFVDGGLSGSTSVGYAGDGTDENLIVWRRGDCSSVAPPGDACHQTEGACAERYNCWDHGGRDTLALTTTSYRVSTGEILDADMELRDRDEATGTGRWFTCPGPPAPLCPGDASGNPGKPDGTCISTDLGSTVTHESGHMLGLAHNCDPGEPCAAPGATMFWSSAPGETSKRALTDDDVAGVCGIYPAAKPPVTTAGVGQTGAACAVPEVPTSGSGCGVANAAAPDAGVLAALALLLRRLRRQVTSTPA